LIEFLSYGPFSRERFGMGFVVVFNESGFSDYYQNGCPAAHFGNILRPASSAVTFSQGTSALRLKPSPNNLAIGCGNPDVGILNGSHGGCAREAFEPAGFGIRPVYHPACSCHPFRVVTD